MAKPGRNDPCPCGSGKKVKKCCSERAATSTSAPEVPHRPTAPLGWIDDDDLDDRSNRVVDLVAAGKLDEAERVCHDLRKRYPEVYDWMERMGHVQEARSNYAEAARYYQQAADFIEGKDGYDPEVGAWLREKALVLETRARSA